MVNTKFVLRRDKNRGNGLYPIFLRLTKNRQSVYISTKIHASEKQWNHEKQSIRKNHPTYKTLNEHLGDLRYKAEKIALNNADKELKEIKSIILGKSESDFVTYANGVIESERKAGRYWNAEHMKFALNKLKEYNGNEAISFKKVDREYIRGFIGFLNDKGNHQNTIAKNLGSLKRIFSIAVEEEKIKLEKNPFHGMKIPKKRTEKKKLSIEEIKAIENIKLPEYTLIWHVRNYFLFSFYTAGTRFIDMCFLKWKHVQDGRLIYKMSKTQIPSNVKLLPPALEILDYYRTDRVDPEKPIFPIIEPEVFKTIDPDRKNLKEEDVKRQKRAVSAKNALCNKYLKKIKDIAEIETNISFHIARHSFADYWRKSGGSLYSLQKMLRHSTLSITEQYIKSFDVETVDGELENVFNGYIKNDKEKTLKLVK